MTAPEESTILSPGVSGSVFNPLVTAEFRRWKARPLTYGGIVLVTLLAICLVYFSVPRAGLPFGSDHPSLLMLQQTLQSLRQDVIARAGNAGAFLDQLIRMIIRPSTILPLMMIWRALHSFRNGGLYKPFRTTFLTPGEFLWGIIAIPFAVSAAVLVLYSGLILGPTIVEGWRSLNPQVQHLAPHPVLHGAGILFEGSLNGAVICLAALWLAARSNVSLTSFLMVLLFVVAVQALQTLFVVNQTRIVEFPQEQFQTLIERFETLGGILPESWANGTFWRRRDVTTMFFLVFSGGVKLWLCFLFWGLARDRLGRGEE